MERSFEAMKVLLAIDGSQASEAALESLIGMRHAQETEVHVVYVVELWPLRFHIPELEPDRSSVRHAMWARAQEVVARAARMLENSGFHVTTAIKEGDPKTDLIDAASEWHADLVIVGSRGRTGVDRLLMGSVSEAVAHYAPCSVQIVRDTRSLKL
jgi:nucleotide-binding universal stress UspA family protein